jgi:hypothetical protein
MAAMIKSVLPAFRAWGRRKAVTPFEIDSTPVRAADPDAKAFKRTKSVKVPVPTATGCGTVATGVWPNRVFTIPTPRTA